MNSPLDTLKQLKEMLDAGTITPQEFEALKQQLVFSQGVAPTASPTEAFVSPAAAATGPVAVSPPSDAVRTDDLPTPAPTGPLPVATPVIPPPAAPTENPEWMAAAAPMLLSTHDALPEPTERRNPLTLVFAIGGALVLLALVLYLALDNKHDSERLTSATQTAADSTAVVPEVGPQTEQITLPPATAPETVRVAPVAPPPVAPAATKFRSDSVAAPAKTTVPNIIEKTTTTTDTAM